MATPDLSNKVQYVVGAGGKPTAVIIDIETWEQIISALEDSEDIDIAREALAKFDEAGGDLKKAGYIPWEKAREELEKEDDLLN